MEILEIVERIGAYAGLAAVFGLAVLSALYFSQARDLRRLREWAGRAPERTAQPRPPVPRPVTGTGQRPVPGPAATSAARAPAPAPATAGVGPASAAAPGPATAGSTATASPAGGQPGVSPSGNGPAPARTGPPRTVAAPPLRSRPATAAAASPAAEPRRLAPRYIALIVAGLLVVGGGIAFGVVTYTSGAEAPPAAPAAAPPGPLAPSSITVAVLNGTTVPGLAAQLGDRVESSGFRLGNVTNASEQQRAESVVLYVPGAAREARAVGRELRIAQTERAENGERTLAGTARVIVVAGADMTDE